MEAVLYGAQPREDRELWKSNRMMSNQRIGRLIAGRETGKVGNMKAKNNRLVRVMLEMSVFLQSRYMYKI